MVKSNLVYRTLVNTASIWFHDINNLSPIRPPPLSHIKQLGQSFTGNDMVAIFKIPLLMLKEYTKARKINYETVSVDPQELQL